MKNSLSISKIIDGKYFKFEIDPEEGLFALCLKDLKMSNISDMNSLDSILGIEVNEFGNLIRFNPKEVYKLLSNSNILKQVEYLCKKDMEEGGWYQ